jgi:hypothetical protein
MAAVQLQRPLRGSRISTFYPVKNLPSLSSLDSAFQLQEYISLLIRLDVHDVDAIVSVPGRTTKQKAKGKEKEVDDDDDNKKAEVTVDEACWKYEQLRCVLTFFCDEVDADSGADASRRICRTRLLRCCSRCARARRVPR